MYVIHKTSRGPGNTSYSGPTWNDAQIAWHYKKQYASREEAQKLATILSEHNPVGFMVSEAKDV